MQKKRQHQEDSRCSHPTFLDMKESSWPPFEFDWRMVRLITFQVYLFFFFFWKGLLLSSHSHGLGLKYIDIYCRYVYLVRRIRLPTCLAENRQSAPRVTKARDGNQTLIVSSHLWQFIAMCRGNLPLLMTVCFPSHRGREGEQQQSARSFCSVSGGNAHEDACQFKSEFLVCHASCCVLCKICIFN